jgi:hypothetical protein
VVASFVVRGSLYNERASVQVAPISEETPMRGSALCTVVPLLCALTRGVGVYTHGAGSGDGRAANAAGTCVT